MTEDERELIARVEAGLSTAEDAHRLKQLLAQRRAYEDVLRWIMLHTHGEPARRATRVLIW
jgi:hypothetical protein